MLTEDEVGALLGREVEQTRVEANGESSGVCAYLGNGDVNVGLFGLGEGTLEPLVSGKTDEGLEVTEVDAPGYREASRVVDPADPAHVDHYLVTDAGAGFRLTVTSRDESLSGDLAEALLALAAD